MHSKKQRCRKINSLFQWPKMLVGMRIYVFWLCTFNIKTVFSLSYKLLVRGVLLI